MYSSKNIIHPYKKPVLGSWKGNLLHLSGDHEYQSECYRDVLQFKSAEKIIFQPKLNPGGKCGYSISCTVVDDICCEIKTEV